MTATITVKDLIKHLEAIDPDTPVFKRAGGTGSGLYVMGDEDFKACFFQGHIDPTAEKNGKFEFDFMTDMEVKRGIDVSNPNSIKILAL